MSSDKLRESDKPPGHAEKIRLRLWPATLITLLTLAAVFLPAVVAPGTPLQFYGMIFGPIVGSGLFFLWWLLASGAPWVDRLTVLAFLVLSGLWARWLAHASVDVAFMVYGVSTLLASFTLWLVVSRSMSWRSRRWGLLVAISLAWGSWCLVRSDGVDGRVALELAWRWSPTAEEQYLLTLRQDSFGQSGSLVLDETPAEEPPARLEIAPELQRDDWPGFRGPHRDSRVADVHLRTDWDANPPREVWHRRIGPGWSSFATVGPRLFTQEQRGEQEAILCLNAETGEEEWCHTDDARFWEAMAGAGPRATPTFHSGRIYALGATGLLNCLDASTGTRIWSRDISVDADTESPQWGFASSPLVVDHAALVYAGGGADEGVIAYNIDDGTILWKAGGGTHSYSSPQLAEIQGRPQALMLTEEGVCSISPASGEILWQHSWPCVGMNRIVQPNVVNGQSVLLGTGYGIGTRLISIANSGDQWTATEEWTSPRLKPYFNDFVVQNDHIFGFDGSVFTCLDAASGKRRWKRGRYGNGQVLLIADQDLLLILSEKGELILLRADPARHDEIARFAALDGKTWNHPVISHGRLYVRNSEQAACFELALEDDGS